MDRSDLGFIGQPAGLKNSVKSDTVMAHKMSQLRKWFTKVKKLPFIEGNFVLPPEFAGSPELTTAALRLEVCRMLKEAERIPDAGGRLIITLPTYKTKMVRQDSRTMEELEEEVAMIPVVSGVVPAVA